MITVIIVFLVTLLCEIYFGKYHQSKIIAFRRNNLNRGIFVYIIYLISISNSVSDGATNKLVLNIERS